MSLADRLRGAKAPQPRGPVWTGPEHDGPNGGVTYSLLSRFLTCRERFRVYAVEGLRPAPQFNHRIEYGHMWHVCEEALAKRHPKDATPYVYTGDHALRDYCEELCRKYPLQQEQIDHWYNVCKVQFPLYVDYWSRHPDAANRTPLYQEKVFDVPYHLPSGRAVRLRGKWDGVALERVGGGYEVVLDEHKTKGDINEPALRRQLTFDLQTMMYTVALEQHIKDGELEGCPDDTALTNYVSAVRYNVVRRPLSGGKGTIVRHKPSKSNPAGESKESFYARVAEYIKEDPGHYFMRWRVEVSSDDVARFRRRCLDPLLEQLCDWWEWVTTGPGFDPFTVTAPSDQQYGIHWQHPFGCKNILDEGGCTDLDSYLETGSMVGLVRVDTLFSELV